MFHVEKEREGDKNKTVVEYGTLQNKQWKSPHIHTESVHYRGLQAQSCVRLGFTNSVVVLFLFLFTLLNVRDCSFCLGSVVWKVVTSKGKGKINFTLK